MAIAEELLSYLVLPLLAGCSSTTTSLWFDRWCSISLLMDILIARDTTKNVCLISSKVAHMIQNGAWQWPPDWAIHFLGIFMLDTPTIVHNTSDMVCWKDQSGVVHPFSVGLVWDKIRAKDDDVT
ncbi:RNA-directed DNA polymerase, eukaryota, Reverse transcriptase zinc-binding domain protein [Artemisia annua]|uniref:RNA-directed DNA polymerase, eukaryota, Reverse transcriptase zinc-binding domain protein n=1 Tax=Artemisia annua TaxID=35608 RepID=A0A2U1PPD3_ARTAN|nr:RNA-directed DNA polymerase, eukaryota, Reverse transcriptase zinc-binding domain protein [Artemisia annua]